MKRKIILGALGFSLLTAGVLIAADHIDAPGVTGPGNTSPANDITDVYAFQSPADNTKLVFVVNTQGLLSPSASSMASFPANVMYEINIDNNNNLVEDLVIQCLVQNGKMRVFGPVAPATTGLNSTVVTSGPVTEVAVTNYGSSSVNTGTNSNGIKVFAGPRDDPFFFDLDRFKEIIAGSQSAFRPVGVDFFAGKNVMSMVIEVPKSLLAGSGTLNVWAEAKTK